MIRRLALVLLLTVPLFAGTFTAEDGTTLHYDVIGDGSPIVLLSGGPGFSPEYLEPIAKKLKGKYSVVLLHQRGTGKSGMDTINAQTHALRTLADDVEGLRRELRQNNLTLVGHSFGGILAMLYAGAYPHRVNALAFIDSGGPTLQAVPKFIETLNSRLTPEENAKVKEWSDPQRYKENHKRAVLELTRAKTAAYFADRAKAQAFANSLDTNSFNDAVFWAITPQMTAGMDLRESLKGLEFPVLVIHGKQDPLETADEMHQTFKGSKLEVLDDAGHFPWLEQPRKFYTALESFLAEVVKR